MNSSNPEFQNRREFVRVYYPMTLSSDEVPVLKILTQSYRVMDISERGIRFINPGPKLIPNRLVSISLRFPDGAVLSLDGSVVRRSYKQVAIHLENEIPFNRIMSEQIRLRKMELSESIRPKNAGKKAGKKPPEK